MSEQFVSQEYSLCHKNTVFVPLVQFVAQEYSYVPLVQFVA